MATSESRSKKSKERSTENDVEADLSEEDLALKTKLEGLVEEIETCGEERKKAALEVMRTEIRNATTTMTSVPKPLKFLRPHYERLKQIHEATPDSTNAALLADVISLLASMSAKEGEREALKYCLLGSNEDVGSWGHEYLRNLTTEITAEFTERQKKHPDSIRPLMDLVEKIVPYQMSHNAEPEAVDLLIEVERLSLLEQHVDDGNFKRTCLYLTSCCQYLPDPDDKEVLRVAHSIYMQRRTFHDAMRVALRLNDRGLVESTFIACDDVLEKKQLCHLLARQGFGLDLESGRTAIHDEDLQTSLQEIISNSKLSEHFMELARDLDVMEPKIPEDVYKMHLVEGRTPSTRSTDSARHNLASTFVNGFVNAGFGVDKLITVPTESDSSQPHWIFRNRDHGKMSAAASLGMVTMWDVDGGLTRLDRYLYIQDNYVVAGALIAIGLVNCCVHNENDPAYALICEHVNHYEQTVRIGAVIGLGLAYAGTGRTEVEELLLPLVVEPDVNIELAGFAALSLGLVFSSTCKQESVEAISEALMVRVDDLSTPFAKMLCLGMGILFLGQQERVEATVEIAKTFDEKISKFCQITLEACAYAGSGNVLKVQEWLSVCGEQIEAESGMGWKAYHQSIAVIGIALVAMTEELGSAMIHRTMEHLLLYGKTPVRSAVPLALAILNVSNPDIYPMDILSRLSHDSDTEVARNAILALGILGAGTNNARLAGMLRNLSSYYYKDQTSLFLVRIAQGLVYMGKGLITINPYHTDGQLLSSTALSGILCVMIACLDLRETIAGKHHFMLYYLATAMKPRYLLTVDEDGKLLPVSVRVGQAVDTVAQAGRPKTITGFQTHNTPVLLAVGERAELATNEYLSLSPILEGVVILKPNPDYVRTVE